MDCRCFACSTSCTLKEPEVVRVVTIKRCLSSASVSAIVNQWGWASFGKLLAFLESTSFGEFSHVDSGTLAVRLLLVSACTSAIIDLWRSASFTLSDASLTVFHPVTSFGRVGTVRGDHSSAFTDAIIDLRIRASISFCYASCVSTHEVLSFCITITSNFSNAISIAILFRCSALLSFCYASSRGVQPALTFRASCSASANTVMSWSVTISITSNGQIIAIVSQL